MRSQILKNLGSNYLLSFAGMLLGFFLVPFLIGTLGRDAYGIIVLAESVVGFFELVTVSIRLALSRYATVASAKQSTEDFVAYLSTGRVIMYFSAALVLMTGFLLSFQFPHIFRVAPEFSDASRIMFFLITLGAAASIPNTVYWSALYAKQRFELINLASSFGLVLRSVLLFVMFSVLPQASRNLVLYGMIYLGMMLLQNAMILFFHNRTLPGMGYPMKNFQKHKVREILSFSGHTSVSRVSAFLFTDTANIIINRLWGPGYNAIFSVSLKMTAIMYRVFIEPGWALTTTFTDLVARGEKQKMESLFFFYSKLLSIATFPICFGLVFYGKALIVLWVGPDFALAGDLVPLWTLHLFLAIPFSLAGCLFNAYGKVKVPSLVTLFSGVLNVILCLLFGAWLAWQLYGIVLAGLLTGTLIVKLWTPYYVKRISGLSSRKYWSEAFVKPVLLSGLVMTGGYALHLFLEQAGGLTAVALLCLTAAAVIFYVLSYCWILSADERRFVAETIGPLRTKLLGGRA